MAELPKTAALPKSQPRRTRTLLPTVYRALLELSQLRDAVTALNVDSAAEAARLMAKVDATELYALALLEQIERRSTVANH